MLENSSTLAVSVPINLSIKFWFCSCKRPQGHLLCGRASYFKYCHNTILLLQLSFLSRINRILFEIYLKKHSVSNIFRPKYDNI